MSEDTTLTVDVRNAAAQRMLQSLARLIGDTSIPNKKLSIELYGMTMRNFKTEGELVTGQRWAPLKAGGRWKGKGKTRRLQTNYMILQDTGQLRSSFVPFSDKEQAGVGALRLGAVFDIETRKKGKRPPELAKIHQEGLGSAPQREMLPRREQALKLAVTVYDMHLNAIIARGRGAT